MKLKNFLFFLLLVRCLESQTIAEIKHDVFGTPLKNQGEKKVTALKKLVDTS